MKAVRDFIVSSRESSLQRQAAKRNSRIINAMTKPGDILGIHQYARRPQHRLRVVGTRNRDCLIGFTVNKQYRCLV